MNDFIKNTLAKATLAAMIILSATVLTYSFTPHPNQETQSFEPITAVIIGQPTGAEKQRLQQLINSEEFQQMQIIFVGSLEAYYLYPNALDNIDVVMLLESQECGTTARKEITRFVANGGSLITFKDTCTKIKNSTQLGWYGIDNELGSAMAARLNPNDNGAFNEKATGKMTIVAESNHPIFTYVKNEDFDSTITLVDANNAQPLAVLGDSDFETPNWNGKYLALEKDYGKGKSIYYAWNVGFDKQNFGKNILIQTIEYAGNHAIKERQQ